MGRYFADHTTMGGSWEQAGPPDLVACSDSVRTKQTLAQWISGFCDHKRDCQLRNEFVQLSTTKLIPVLYDRTIYEAETGLDLLHYLSSVHTDVRVLLLVVKEKKIEERKEERRE